MSLPRAAHLPRWLLAGGMALGAVVSGWHIIEREGGDDLPSHAVAQVGERLILRDEWLRAVAAVASERRTPLSDDDQRHVLDRLVDEALLLQHGVELELVARDARLRGMLVYEVMQAAIDARRETPDEAELRAFYAENRALFGPPPQLRVAAWRLDADGERRPFSPPVPDALLPPGQLRAYVGPSLTEAAMRLPEAAISEPVAINGGKAVIEVRERREVPAQDFEQVREQVLHQWKREADEGAVRSLLDELRQRYRVRIAP